MVWRMTIQTTIWLLVMGAIVFAAGGGLAWPQAWVFLAESGVSGFTIGAWLTRHDPALLAARLSSLFHRDQSPWDRVFLGCAGLGFIAWLVLAAVDAHRFRWSVVPLWAQALGAVLIALCMVGVSCVFAANSFAAPQVRHQAERGQVVVTTGPYRFVRHPMYAFATLYFLGVPLLLGSWWALLPVPLFAIAFGARAIGEERMLRQALPGYDAYTGTVRFRLIPGIW
jgi:protein-S-isoprenylcysteine O-methyltransferase Ste14